MTIRNKTILIVLPLILAPLLVSVGAAVLASRNGITTIAASFLQFKAEELKKYADGQWDTLSRYGFDKKDEYRGIAQAAVEAYALSVVKSDTEIVLAVDRNGSLAMSTAPLTLSGDEERRLKALFDSSAEGWRTLELGGASRVAQVFAFPPFDWLVLVTERHDVFYAATSQILLWSAVILLVSLAAAVVLLIAFTRYLTRPITSVAAGMKSIITTGDFKRKVEIDYQDEIGELGHTFNLMTAELDRAYNKIKAYAFSAVMAKKTEKNIRTLFQRYVPAAVIDEIYRKPESMLVGANRELAILFSDIRGFTGISEKLGPDEIVNSLNAYFSIMVDIVLKHTGIVDKYIGDALMAFFGAPVKSPADAANSVLTAIEMQDELKGFNGIQSARGRPEFSIGVGVSFGTVTIGNIGSDKKLEYTVIGDDVNTASRLQDLTKFYPENVLISDSVYERVRGNIPCRLVDKIVVRGKRKALSIYTPRRVLSEREKADWDAYTQALDLYFARRFDQAAARFLALLTSAPEDKLARMFLRRARIHLKNPPPADWTGVVKLEQTAQFARADEVEEL